MRARRVPIAATGVCVMIVPLLLSACAGSPGASSDMAQTDERPGIVVGAATLDPTHEDVLMPLGSFQLLPTEYALLRRASDLLVQECVERAGFHLAFPSREATGTLSVTHFSFGVWTESRAATYGYGLVPRAAEESAFEADLATGGRDRLSAVQGCNAEPEASELNDGKESTGIASRADSESWLQMESDPRSAAIIEAHRTCMAGHNVQIGDDWSVEGLESMSQERRVSTALVDVECKRESNFVQGLADIAAAYQQIFIARNLAALEEESAQLELLLVRAKQIVDSPA